jgi:hypothetical protein
MAPTKPPPHSDELDVALEHYNERFRHRYQLPELSPNVLIAMDGFAQAWADLGMIRAGGVIDASCAQLAKIALSVTPRYAIGLVDAQGSVRAQAPLDGAQESYRSHQAILVNPLGGRDNWRDVSRWVKVNGSERQRRAMLAGLASEDRPDEDANNELLWDAAAQGRPAVLLPPDEAFSLERAAEVSFIYDVEIETLRAWKQKYRSELAAGKPGRPKNR